jgi:hypothetical protein
VQQDFQAKTLWELQVLQVQPVDPALQDDQVNAVELVNEVTEVVRVRWELQVLKVCLALLVETVNQDQKVPKVQWVCLVSQENEVFQVVEVNLV